MGKQKCASCSVWKYPHELRRGHAGSRWASLKICSSCDCLSKRTVETFVPDSIQNEMGMEIDSSSDFESEEEIFDPPPLPLNAQENVTSLL
jgi:hypothetical protein